jgi:hypothetical protein
MFLVLIFKCGYGDTHSDRHIHTARCLHEAPIYFQNTEFGWIDLVTGIGTVRPSKPEVDTGKKDLK